MRLFGFKTCRYQEWLTVIKIEFGKATLRDKIRLFVTMIRSIRWSRDKTFRRKYRSCCSCPLYHRDLRRCRPYNDSPAGCGCYMPFKIALGGGCWINETFPEEDLGWRKRN